MQNIDRHVDLWELFPFTPEVGYLGLTIVSFFGSLIPFVPIPSFVLVATMAVGEQFDIHVLVIIAALTSTAAKQIILRNIKLSTFIPPMVWAVFKSKTPLNTSSKCTEERFNPMSSPN